MVNKYCLFQCVKQACWSLINPVVRSSRKSLCYISAHRLQAREGVWASRPWCGICQKKFYLACMNAATSTSHDYKLRLKSCSLKPKLSGKVLMFWLWAGTMGSAEQFIAPGKAPGAATAEAGSKQLKEDKGKFHPSPWPVRQCQGCHLPTPPYGLSCIGLHNGGSWGDRWEMPPVPPTGRDLPLVLQWWWQWHWSAALFGGFASCGNFGG